MASVIPSDEITIVEPYEKHAHTVNITVEQNTPAGESKEGLTDSTSKSLRVNSIYESTIVTDEPDGDEKRKAASW